MFELLLIAAAFAAGMALKSVVTQGFEAVLRAVRAVADGAIARGAAGIARECADRCGAAFYNARMALTARRRREELLLLINTRLQARVTALEARPEPKPAGEAAGEELAARVAELDRRLVPESRYNGLDVRVREQAGVIAALEARLAALEAAPVAEAAEEYAAAMEPAKEAALEVIEAMAAERTANSVEVIVEEPEPEPEPPRSNMDPEPGETPVPFELIKAVRAAIPKDDPRYYLNNLLVEIGPGGEVAAIASDGTRMHVAGERTDDPVARVLVPREHVRGGAGGIRPLAQLKVDASEGTWRIRAPNGAHHYAGGPSAEGTYPEVGRLIPTDAPAAAVIWMDPAGVAKGIRPKLAAHRKSEAAKPVKEREELIVGIGKAGIGQPLDGFPRVKARALMDALTPLDGMAHVRFHGEGGGGVVVIEGLVGEDVPYTALIVPVRA